MLDLRIVNLPGQRIPFPQSKGRKRRLVAAAQPKVRTQHGNNRTVIAHQFARVDHESPAVALANAKGNTGPLLFIRNKAAIIVIVQPESITSSTRITGAGRIPRSTENAPSRLRTCWALFSMRFCGSVSRAFSITGKKGMPSCSASRRAKSDTNSGCRFEETQVTHCGNGSGCQRSRIRVAEAATSWSLK